MGKEQPSSPTQTPQPYPQQPVFYQPYQLQQQYYNYSQPYPVPQPDYCQPFPGQQPVCYPLSPMQPFQGYPNVNGLAEQQYGMSSESRLSIEIEKDVDQYFDYLMDFYDVFKDPSVRQKLRRNVFTIVTILHLVRFAWLYVGLYVEPIKSILNDFYWPLTIVFGVYSTVIYLVSIISFDRLSKHPWDVALLLLGTFPFIGTFVCIMILFDPLIILVTEGISCFMTILLTVLSFKPKMEYYSVMEAIVWLIFALMIYIVFGMYILPTVLKVNVETKYLVASYFWNFLEHILLTIITHDQMTHMKKPLMPDMYCYAAFVDFMGLSNPITCLIIGFTNCFSSFITVVIGNYDKNAFK